MKTFVFVVLGVLLCSVAQAQVLYGTTSGGGGANGKGAISKLNVGSNILSAAYTLEDPNPDGKLPLYTDMVQASDGKMYGMTFYGGTSNLGTLFMYNPANAAYTKLLDFNGSNGSNPAGSLVQASDGKLYGTTAGGGNGNYGVLFSFNPSNAAFTKIKDLDSTNGAYPYGSLVQASNGKLYGLTVAGGNKNFGTLFSFTPGTAVFSKLKDFDSTNGASPYGSLLQATDGKLYGMTAAGGSGNYGTIFSFNISNNAFTKLKEFNNTTGANPRGSLVQAADGKMYGMTYNGGIYKLGVIFSFNPTNSSYTKLYDFDDVNGANPRSSLFEATDGNLYGLATSGGLYDRGVLFSFNPNNNAYSHLFDFDGINGGNPNGSPRQATDGKLYALARTGGSGYGVIFSYVPATKAFSKLQVFGTYTTGANIVGGLAKDGAGKLYGMFSYGGGAFGLGGIFSYDPVSNTYKKLLDFNNNNGANPKGNLLMGNDGKLYGMTYSGGGKNFGVLFSYHPGTAVYSRLKDFDSTNGSFPYGGLVQASNGKLYGLTYGGGTKNRGTLFSYDPAGAIFSKLFDFKETNGAYPYGNLVQASNGKLYGLFSYGGSNGLGGIFSYDPVKLVYKTLFNFSGVNGAFPHGSLVQASNGKLYGMTYSGGKNGGGTLFSFELAGAVFSKLKDFDRNNGRNPRGSLVQASNGKLYGMTTYGGKWDDGIAFSFDPATAVYTTVGDFGGANGSNPMLTYFTEAAPAVTVKINNVSTPEGNSGQKSIAFAVTLSAAYAQPVTVDYTTANGTAKAGTDYVAQSGTLTFAPGTKKQNVSIVINGDTQVENDEKFKVLLGNAVNANFKDSVGVCTILNDDVSAARTAPDNITTLQVAVSPTPASSSVTVQCAGFAGKTTLQLLDAQGNKLKEATLQAPGGKYAQLQWDVSTLANGTYYLRVFDEAGKTQTQTVLIAR